MLNSSQVTFWGDILGGTPPLKTPEVGQNNCLTYNFLHSEFVEQFKSLIFGGHFGGFSPR